jgi:hypothetical protein
MRDGLIGGNPTLAQTNKELGTVFRIQKDLTARQHKVYNEAWDEAGQRSNSEKGEEWTVVGPTSKPRLLPRRKLEEGQRLSKKKRRKVEQEKSPKRLCRTALFRRWLQGFIR